MGVRRKRWIIAIVAVVVIAGASVALAVGLSGGGSTPTLTHVAFARLYTETAIGDSRTKVMSEWPKKPYQTYSDGFKNQCFEWWDRPLSLYNLCFRKGVLVTKSLA
jgi:hypothetical protein